ncbi:MAG: DHH family phosphoesterase [Candidatus Thermoplasmatota archaeon]
MSFEAFQSAALRAAAVVRAKPPGTRWFLDCDTDADGLCAAAVCANALRAVGHRFTIRASRDKHDAAYRALFDTDADGHILLDKGSSHLLTLAQGAQRTGRPVIVLDHHNLPEPTPPGVTMLNPRDAGLDGSRDASAATTTVAFALALAGDAAKAWAPVGLSGAIGDFQHVPDWKGWNLHLLEQSRAAGHVRDLPQPLLIGVTLAQAIAQRQPDIPQLHDDLAACEALLDALGIDPESEVEDLNHEERTRLVSALTLRILAAGRSPDEAAALVQPVELNVRLGTSLRHAFRIVDACGREGQAATGIAYLLGDRTAKSEALAIFSRYKSTLHDGLKALAAQGTALHAAVQSAWTQDPSYTGMVAGLGMVHVVRDRARPLAILAVRPDGQVQVSTRGLERMVRKGLDLGKACSIAAKAVGSEGGGHPVAAGAVIAKDRADAFLDVLDHALSQQGFLEAAA